MSTKEEFSVWPVGKHHFKHDNDILEIPAGWIIVPPGDATLTRRIKANGEYWVILGKYKNKVTSQGLCAPEIVVNQIKSALDSERATPEYQKKLDASRKYRENKQNVYVQDFEQEVLDFLHFHERWSDIAKKLAYAVTIHATPVGSGTVARTQRIPIEERAEAAVIAWMRHQTTAYDNMYIPHIAGERREVRRKLAEISRKVLAKYKSGADIDLTTCPLYKALYS